MSDPVRVPPSGGPGHWRRWLLPVLASAAWLVLTFCLYRHAVQGEQAHLLELCHTRLAATAHQLMDARDWNAGHGGVYVPLSAYGEPNPWLPEKDRTLQTADGRTLVLMNPAYMSRQMAERLTEPGFRLAIVGQAPLRPGNRADDWERRILATATQGGQVFFSGEDCLPQGRLRLLRTLAAQESCLRCHQGHKEGDMLGGISISMDAAAYVRDLERKQRELGLLYGLLALTGVLAVGGITSNLTLRRLQAEEKSRLKSAFMGRLSHDMRTPLAAMLGMSDLLDRQDCGTEQRHTALAYLRRACGALLEMVDDITDHASLEQGDVRLRCRTFDLPACLRACADLYRPAAEGKGLELLLHLAPHLPRQVRGDDFRLRQALGNLVSNAVKFTERGRVDVEAGGGRLASGVFLLRLDVRDSGPGLEPGEERTVFESFCRGSAAGGKPGTGLGLNIVRTIARRMGGDVQVRSCPGQGCTFTLEVRLEIVEGGPGPKSGTPCPAEEGIAASAPAAGPLQGLRVLVAEDDAAGRYLLEVRLREQGCTVGLAADGEQVLDMLAAAAWDVILLDAGMPRMDGLTVLERIRAGQSAASRQQAVIVHSAGLAPGEEARFRSLGVRALLDKPVPPAMLLAALRDVPRGCPGDGQAGPTPCGAEAEAPVIWDRAAALAATNQDLEAMSEDGRFRKDLLYRLQGMTIVIPPLRRRRDEIPLLARQAVIRCCRRNGMEEKELSPLLLEMLAEYDWPGNVRELFHALERACLAAEHASLLLPAHLATGLRVAVARSRAGQGRVAGDVPGGREVCPPLAEAGACSVPDLPPMPETGRAFPSLRSWRHEAERHYVARVRALCGDDARAAARMAGVSRGHWYELLKKYGF